MKLQLHRFVIVLPLVLLVAGDPPRVSAQQTTPPPSDVFDPEDCEAHLARLQRQVLDRFPHRLDSIRKHVTDERSTLFGYELSHGDVVLAGMGLTLVQFADSTKPELLFYWPAEASASEWLDFDGPDGPYELVGWGYLPELYEPSPDPPAMECIDGGDWFVHEAGWHLLDGDMVATPESRLEEPDIPRELKGKVLYWHPAGWDLHLWIRSAVPEVSLLNRAASEGGLVIEDRVFWYPEAN